MASQSNHSSPFTSFYSFLRLIVDALFLFWCVGVVVLYMTAHKPETEMYATVVVIAMLISVGLIVRFLLTLVFGILYNVFNWSIGRKGQINGQVDTQRTGSGVLGRER